MKKIIMIIATSLLIGNANAKSAFTEEQRIGMLEIIPSKLTSVWLDPHIKSCWGQATTGSDKALSALYLIATGQETITNIAAKRRAILSAGKTRKEIQLNMRKSFNKSDYKRLERAVIGLPKSWKYCEVLHNKIEKLNENNETGQVR